MSWCTAQWKMLLFCEKNIMKEAQYLLFYPFFLGFIWRPSGLVLSQCFLAPLGVLFIMKTLEDERQVVITAYKLAVAEILRDSLY